MKTRKIFSLLLALAVTLGSFSFAGTAQAAPYADMTIMIYMIGSDLESKNGAATKDIQEIINANFGSNIKIVVQSGGTKDWKNNVMKDGTVERYELKSGTLSRLGTVQNNCMVDYGNLADFISWTAANYPSRSKALIFWDHGGGTLGGFGHDELYTGKRLHLSDIAEALETAGVHFDWIGFDACLMATVEAACVLAPYADYMIASEESEPAVGWYYTNWLTKLGRNPGMSAEAQGKNIIDDYAATVKSGQFCLSMIDLEAIDNVYTELSAYLQNSASLLQNSRFTELSVARSNCKSFGEGSFDQIDIVDYVNRVSSVNGRRLVNAVNNAVVYNGGGLRNANGLAMYYPYKYPANYNAMNTELTQCGLDIYPQYFDQFVSVLAGAQQSQTQYTQTYEGTSVSIFDLLEMLWYDPGVAETYAQESSQMADVYNNLEIFWKDGRYYGDEGYYALRLSDKDWQNVTYIEQCVMLDDGNGYIDYGNDNYFEFDDDGDLKVDFDFKWVALDGQIVTYYAEAEEQYDDGSWYTYGYTPAVLNGESDVQVMLYWDNNNPDGYVAGWRYANVDGGQSSKGWYEFYVGDTLDFCCDYYDYNGDFQGVYYFGETYEIDGYLPAVSYESIGYGTVLINYHLVDVFQNNYYTQSVQLEW